MKLSPIAKAVVTAVGGLATALAPIVADDAFNASEAGQFSAALAVAALTVYGVWKARNKPKDDTAA